MCYTYGDITCIIAFGDFLGQKSSTSLQSSRLQEPENATAWHNRGSLHERLGDGEAAMRDYTEACRLDPERPLAFASLGRLLEQQGRYTEAVEQLDKALALDGDEVDFYRCRAACLRAMSHWDSAADDFAK